jgi:hypothetical protein
MLSEPILQPSKIDGRKPTKLWRKVGPGGVKNKDLGRGKSVLRLRNFAIVNPQSGNKPQRFRN